MEKYSPCPLFIGQRLASIQMVLHSLAPCLCEVNFVCSSNACHPAFGNVCVLKRWNQCLLRLPLLYKRGNLKTKPLAIERYVLAETKM
jgi:hypothetical protein